MNKPLQTCCECGKMVEDAVLGATGLAYCADCHNAVWGPGPAQQLCARCGKFVGLMAPYGLRRSVYCDKCSEALS